MRTARALAGAALLAAALLLPAGGSSAPPSPAAVALPVLGPADGQAVLMGAAPASAQAGEVWAYRSLPADVGPPTFAGRPLEFGPVANPRNPTSQLAFLRYTDASGWQYVQTPLDELGHPYRGPVPNRSSVRVTPHGGGVLIGRDTTRAADAQAVVVARDPGDTFRALPAPPAGVLLAGEAVAGDRGSGQVADAAIEEGQHTGLFVAPQGLDAEPAVLHWDGTAWTRETVEVPVGSETHFQIFAIEATSASNAWLLARPDPALGLGIVLYHRDGTTWKRADLGSTFWSQAGTNQVQALGGAAQPLTVTTQSVWIDARLHVSAGDLNATLHYDIGQGKVNASWCDDATLCDHPLGVSLSIQQGYRSFAWPGPGFGTRVITNPLAAGGGEDTNRGTWLRLQGDAFTRMPGAGGNFRPSGAFFDDHDGWVEGPVHIGPSLTAPNHLTQYPAALRAPLTAIAAAPGQTSGAPGSGALAVGVDGAVARFTPSGGWTPEFLLTSSGAVSHPRLRGVAWPEPGVAHAVGDLGAMWQWRADTGLWEADPAAPIGVQANFMGVAFDPGNPERGYAVGKGGVLLRYDKTWTQDPLPAGFASADLTSIAFAGRQALVAAGTDVLENDGGGWHVDQQLHSLLASLPAATPSIITVAGLPDGGAVAAGRDVVLERDRAGDPWRFSDQPLPGATAIAAAAVRAGARVQAIVSVVPQLTYPVPDILPPPDPNVPPPLIPAFPLPGDGYVLRETPTGWSDEQQAAFSGSGLDRPVKRDPVLALLLGPGGEGWAIGGWSGQSDAAGRGDSAGGAGGSAVRSRVQTAGLYRYSPGAPPAAAASVRRVGVATPAGPVRFAIAGHAECEQPCADLSTAGIGPDRTLTATLSDVAALHGQANGPRALLYTGGRLRPQGNAPEPSAEAQRFAQLLGAESSLPVFAAASEADTAGGGTAYRDAFGSFGAPFGSGGAAPGVTPIDLPGSPAPGSGARTHYAFDSGGAGGTVRVVVIDNSSGSLATSDPHQNPAEPQAPWLAAVLADARTKGIPAIVVGSRDLNSRFRPQLSVAGDANAEAQILIDGGASAYFFERPEENRQEAIPAGGTTTIPEFGTGTLGYRSPVSGATTQDVPDSLFGDAGYLLAELDAARRDPGTNRAPVRVRLIPVVSDVSLDALDGTLIRRSRVALFAGLGRRPIGGDRWGPVSADGSPEPPGADPYTAFPPALCRIAGCSTRIAPEYSFVSSDTDIADFVAVDPNTSNLRKPLQSAQGKVITDPASGLLCAFNGGTTTVTIQAGGLAFSAPVTVLDGSVQQPCGTRPLNPTRFKKTAPQVSTPPPPAPAPAPASSPPPPVPAPPAPPPPPAPQPHPKPPALHATLPPVIPAGPVPITPPTFGNLPGTPPPGNPAAGRPIPPGGAVARVYQVEEKREEEAAPEQSQAFSRYHPHEHLPLAPFLYGAIVLAAFAGATTYRGVRGRRRPVPARAETHYPTPRRRR